MSSGYRGKRQYFTAFTKVLHGHLCLCLISEMLSDQTAFVNYYLKFISDRVNRVFMYVMWRGLRRVLKLQATCGPVLFDVLPKSLISSLGNENAIGGTNASGGHSFASSPSGRLVQDNPNITFSSTSSVCLTGD